jgi:ubiquinone/menaquinone biosynthesis C-methylase UbiE
VLTFNLKRIHLPPKSKVLDVGCGEGRHIFGSLYEFTDVYCIGLDQDIPSLEKCKEGLEFFIELDSVATVFMQGSVDKLPFEDNSFDLVICSEVLEHLLDYHVAIDEIYRVLKPGGKFLPSVPSYWPEKICWTLSRAYQNIPGGHVRIFKKHQVINEIINHGFKYDYSERFHGLHSAYWWLRCLFWKNQDSNFLVRIYKKFLEYQILNSPRWLNNFEEIINPIFGKSIAFYFEKND